MGEEIFSIGTMHLSGHMKGYFYSNLHGLANES